MTKKQEQQMNDYYTELLNNGSIKTLNEAFIFKLSYEKAFSLNGVGNLLKDKNYITFEKWIETNYVKWDNVLYASKQGLLKDRQTLYRLYLAEYDL